MFSFQIQINNSNIMVVFSQVDSQVFSQVFSQVDSQVSSQVSSQDTHPNNQVIHHKADSPEDILEEVSVS